MLTPRKSHSNPIIAIEQDHFMTFNGEVVDGLDISDRHLTLLLNLSERSIKSYLQTKEVEWRAKQAPSDNRPSLLVVRLALEGYLESVVAKPDPEKRFGIYGTNSQIFEHVYPQLNAAKELGYIPSIQGEVPSEVDAFKKFNGTWLAVSLPPHT